jgi:hypothetical protein
MAPDEICRRLGEARVKEMFHALNANAMKKVLSDCGIPAVRLPSHSSTRKRNDDWANRLWKAMGTPQSKSCTLFLYQWLGSAKSDMLSAFLDSIGVPHQRGLTDKDFLAEVPEEKVLEAARALLQNDKFDRREVAIYLTILDLTNRSRKFESLDLDQYIPASVAAAAPAAP